MLPVLPTTTSYTLPPPIVNTAVPGNSVAHVPYDNVAPSVSSPQADNNARGNSATRLQTEQAPAPLPQAISDYSPTSYTQSASAPVTSGVQSTFVAQLAGQDTSPETQGVLVEYEKMVSFSNVKYAPSDAAKPSSEPASLFGKILQADTKPAVQPAPVQQQAAVPAEAAQISAITITAPSAEVRAAVRATKSTVSDVDAVDTDAASNDNAPAEETQAAPPPRGISAYLATASRVASFQPASDATAEIA